MRLTLGLQGGFGEKGRTSVSVADASTCVMLDAGIQVGAASDADYHPALSRPATAIDALFLSHAHEDHVGALPWLLAQGFAGPVYLTAETRAQLDRTLSQYARPADLARFPASAADLRLIAPGQRVRVGALEVSCGDSGHVAGGVWFAVEAAGRRILYAADVMPHSAVFPMAPLPGGCDLALLDASYGTDDVPAPERARAVTEWLSRRGANGCVLPTPLAGRSLELLAILDRPFAIAADMRAPLREQIGDGGVLRPGLGARLLARLEGAADWQPGTPLPAQPLLVHDGMGSAGPARDALAQAGAAGWPVLLTGHLPAGSPGALMKAAGTADWLRMPTHPTLPENRAMWEAAGRPPALGHSCPPPALDALAAALPGLDPTARTGMTLTLEDKTRCGS